MLNFKAITSVLILSSLFSATNVLARGGGPNDNAPAPVEPKVNLTRTAPQLEQEERVIPVAPAAVHATVTQQEDLAAQLATARLEREIEEQKAAAAQARLAAAEAEAKLATTQAQTAQTQQDQANAQLVAALNRGLDKLNKVFTKPRTEERVVRNINAFFEKLK